MIKSGVISETIGMLPAMKITEPYSPSARAKARAKPVIFIAGNLPMISEITPLLIITKLEQYDYAGATAIAVVMLVAAFLLLLAINALQWWSRRYAER